MVASMNDMVDKQEYIHTTYIEGYHDIEAVQKMEYRQLGDTKLMVSKLSLGVSSLGSVFRTTDNEESYNVVECAVKSGINLIDTAPWYGQGKAEQVLGQALITKEIPRSAFYLSTKVGRYEPEMDKMFDFSAQRTTQSVMESLKRIGVDYIDIIQVHDVEFAPSVDVIINETLPSLQKLKESDKVKYIGITGYPLNLLKDILERSTVKIDTILTYCHYCLNDTSLLEYLDYFKSKGVGVINASVIAKNTLRLLSSTFVTSKGVGIINASPTGMGLLTNRGPPVWHPATQDIKDICKQAAEYAKGMDVDISSLALHFTCNNSDIPTTLVSTASLKNIRSNIDVCCRQLSKKEIQVLNDVRDRYFIPLKNKTWENIEVKQYWKDLNKLTNAD